MCLTPTPEWKLGKEIKFYPYGKGISEAMSISNYSRKKKLCLLNSWRHDHRVTGKQEGSLV